LENKGLSDAEGIRIDLIITGGKDTIAHVDLGTEDALDLQCEEPSRCSFIVPVLKSESDMKLRVITRHEMPSFDKTWLNESVLTLQYHESWALKNAMYSPDSNRAAPIVRVLLSDAIDGHTEQVDAEVDHITKMLEQRTEG